jgi:hypothetical protein
MFDGFIIHSNEDDESKDILKECIEKIITINKNAIILSIVHNY